MESTLTNNLQDQTESLLSINSKEEEVAQLLSEMRQGSLPTSPVQPPSSAFISRVSQLPMINSTIKTIGEVYESGKNTSQIIKFSAEKVENSVKQILETTRPMLSRLEPGLGQLDSFACHQLDRIERYSSATFSNNPGSIEITSESSSQSMAGWNGVFMGGHESLKSLQFCIEWLRHASSHIDNQIKVLREAMSSWVNVNINDGNWQSLLTLAANVKREVVATMKKMVEIMGNYAGKALPQEARNLVRGFILSLPARWQAVQYHSDSSSEVERVISLADESNKIIKNTLAVFDHMKKE